MLIVTALFLILLATAHIGNTHAVDLPLSFFREQHPFVGYTLFFLLALINCLHLWTYCRLRLGRELFIPAASLVLLSVITLTPSPDTGHSVAAFILLGLVFGWYSVRLYWVTSPWLLVHVIVPPLLLLATGAASYGVWQKPIIIYFVLAANIDCLLVTGRLALPGPDDFKRKRRRGLRVNYTPPVIQRRTDRQSPVRRVE